MQKCVIMFYTEIDKYLLIKYTVHSVDGSCQPLMRRHWCMNPRSNRAIVTASSSDVGDHTTPTPTSPPLSTPLLHQPSAYLNNNYRQKQHISSKYNYTQNGVLTENYPKRSFIRLRHGGGGGGGEGGIITRKKQKDISRLFVFTVQYNTMHVWALRARRRTVRAWYVVDLHGFVSSYARTHWAISRSNQCSTTDTTKVVIWTILCVKLNIIYHLHSD